MTKTSFLQHLTPYLSNKVNGLCFAFGCNSNSQFKCLLKCTSFIFAEKNTIEKEYFAISVLHGITVFKKLDDIRN